MNRRNVFIFPLTKDPIHGRKMIALSRDITNSNMVVNLCCPSIITITLVGVSPLTIGAIDSCFISCMVITDPKKVI
jgi:hypothetical protein